MRTRRALAAFFCVLFIVLSAVGPVLRRRTGDHPRPRRPAHHPGRHQRHANNGDTVLVAPGTYAENIDFKGKAITVTSSAGPATTILDGRSAGAAVTFKTGETSSSTISGFTIQHGGSFPVPV